jgi:hypothetical protein
MKTRSVATAAFVLALGLTLAGCTPSSDSVDDAAIPSATSTASSTPAPASTTPSGTSTPGAGSGADSDADSDDADAPTSGVPANGAATGPGCPANGVAIPAGATVSAIEDVDGDGLADTQFFQENPEFAYGISTASGATYLLKDSLAGPNAHSGWSAPLENGLVVTVLDDGRAARLYPFINCAFVATTTADGSDLDLYLRGFGDAGTGVECTAGNGGRWLSYVQATRLDTGRFTITGMSIDVSRDGATASFGYSSEIATDIAADDPRVDVAMRSSCGDVPKVATSGM